jgi:hypothetical protein
LSRREALPPIDEVFCFMENEIWKDIPNYEGIYQVSNFGRVKRIKKGKEESFKNVKPHPNGYIYNQLSKKGKLFSFCVHVLVCMAFKGYNPTKNRYIHIDHIDGNKLNNFESNLQIISARENNLKSRKRKSKYYGVTQLKNGRWQARIENRGIRKSLGCFDTDELASIAYQKALSELTT